MTLSASRTRAALRTGALDAIGTTFGLEDFARIVQTGGPQPQQHGPLTLWFEQVRQCWAAGALCDDDIGALRALAEHALTDATLQGQSLCKQHGYAGDFALIDRIYGFWQTPDPMLRAWDRFFHAQPAVRAVRNRKDYFKSAMLRHALQMKPFDPYILALASGPCREIWELLSEHPGLAVRVDCLDSDPGAIEFARELLDKDTRAELLQRNPLRAPTDRHYSLIFSAGLFDYLRDKTFVRLAARLRQALRPGGELVIGNFASGNPSRGYMEIMGDWRLHHRTPAELVALMAEAGFDPALAGISAEAEKVDLFIHVRR